MDRETSGYPKAGEILGRVLFASAFIAVAALFAYFMMSVLAAVHA